MTFWKDKEGNELTRQEFMSRWKKGIEGITPEQKLKTQIWGYRITMLGFLCGIVVSIIGLKNLWWLMIVLIGGLIINLVQYLGIKQQLIIFENIKEQFKEAQKDE